MFGEMILFLGVIALIVCLSSLWLAGVAVYFAFQKQYGLAAAVGVPVVLWSCMALMVWALFRERFVAKSGEEVQ